MRDIIKAANQLTNDIVDIEGRYSTAVELLKAWIAEENPDDGILRRNTASILSMWEARDNEDH